MAAGLEPVRARRVILLGPNHRNAGRVGVATATASWRTSAGTLTADVPAVRGLSGLGKLVGEDVGLLASEHSIALPMPLLARWGARSVVPLALRSNLRASELAELADALAPLLDEQTVVVAAVDFAHGVSAGEAAANDAASSAALAALDAAPFLRWGPDHTDGRTVLPVLLNLMRRAGARRYEPLESSRSDLGGGRYDGDVTSYLAAWFAGGSAAHHARGPVPTSSRGASTIAYTNPLLLSPPK
jgi:AmmeMemoRadiSam system protein B